MRAHVPGMIHFDTVPMRLRRWANVRAPFCHKEYWYRDVLSCVAVIGFSILFIAVVQEHQKHGSIVIGEYRRRVHPRKNAVGTAAVRALEFVHLSVLHGWVVDCILGKLGT